MKKTNLGETIYKLRKQRGITQEELGRAVNVSTQAVSKWEHGGSPDAEMLPLLADYFHVSIDSLYGRSETAARNIFDDVLIDLINKSKEERFEHAFQICWAMIRGLVGIDLVKNIYYDNRPQLPKESEMFMKSLISLDEGVAYMLLKKEFHYFMLFPEPKGGFNQELADAADYTELFSFLAKPDTVKILLFIFANKAQSFTASLIVSRLKIEEAAVLMILDEMTDRSWLYRTEIETEDKLLISYQLSGDNQILPFLIIAKALIDSQTNLYYMNLNDRHLPLFSGKGRKNE